MNNLGINKKVLLFSFSLNPNSRSYLLLKSADDYLSSLNVNTELIDMRKYQLPFCDGTKNMLTHPTVRKLLDHFYTAQKIIIASPIYNYDINASFKNFIDLLSIEHQNNSDTNNTRVLAFMGAMGSSKSYLSGLSSLNYLHLVLGYYLLPSFVMCSPKDFSITGELNTNLKNKIKILCNNLIEQKI
ncbi:NAD(P)H-dependent oxidoreductase [Candidatus Tisiphia endosymbiont of Metellina segmentata]|uniref:NADPH-dependent FMN reductase n=1 Tax=Candidatus Tisiphia endosymbiont of Metellina segmentata TaxID=3066274 RepID=UPI00313B4E36